MKGKSWAVPKAMESLPYPKLKKYPNKRFKVLPDFSESFFYFIGRWLGDGWVRDYQRADRPAGQKNATIYLCDSEDKIDELQRTMKCISEHFSFEYCDTCVKVKCSSRALCDFLTENFGKYAYGKEIPSWVFTMTQEYRTAMLRGIFDSDGYRKKDSYRITTVSKKLAFGIRILAESLGYSTSIYFTETPERHIIKGRNVNQRNTYTVNHFSESNNNK